LLNEEELCDELQECGFTRVHCEDLTAREQRKLFSEAEMIIAPHGAALTNLVFCQLGTRVVELFPPGYVDPSMWPLISHSDLRHYYLVGHGHPAYSESNSARNQDFTVSVAAVRRFVETELWSTACQFAQRPSNLSHSPVP
jgi:capsular polysaccharide biosynthesis protein